MASQAVLKMFPTLSWRLLDMQASADADEINAQEKLFGMACTKYSQVSRMAAKLEPYCSLWALAARFYDKYATWMSGPFGKLKPEEVETEVSDAYRKVYKLSKVSLLFCLQLSCDHIWKGSRSIVCNTAVVYSDRISQPRISSPGVSRCAPASLLWATLHGFSPILDQARGFYMVPAQCLTQWL